MMTFTHEDFKKMDRKWKRNFQHRVDSLDEEERLLRDKLEIDRWKSKLEEVRTH